MTRILQLFCALCLLLGTASAATWPAADASWTAVRAAVDLASDGDTVTIPASSAHWTTNLHYSTAITLQGAGTNSTIIYDDIPDSATSIDSGVIRLDTVSNKFYRVTGIQFPNATTRTTTALTVGQIYILGYSKAVRIDHCWFGKTLFREKALRWRDATCGVMDHCAMLNPVRQFDVFHDHWGNGSGWADGYGDGSWASDSTMGTTNTVMAEDCYMEMSANGDAFTDSFDGGRWCVRYCTLKNGHLDSHEGTTRTRATRQIEIYGNTMTIDAGNGLFSESRGGACVIFSNTLIGCTTICTLQVNRAWYLYEPWGVMNGTNAWDNIPQAASFTGNFTGSNGDHYDGGSSATITVSNVLWTTNQWVGYSLINMNTNSINSFADGHLAAPIISNTKSNLTYYYGQSLILWTNGDGLKLYYVTNGMDTASMGKGDLITGDTAPPAFWPHQAIEGCYEWANTDVAVHFGIPQPVIREGTNYFNNTPKPGYTLAAYPNGLIPTVATVSQLHADRITISR